VHEGGAVEDVSVVVPVIMIPNELDEVGIEDRVNLDLLGEGVAKENVRRARTEVLVDRQRDGLQGHYGVRSGLLVVRQLLECVEEYHVPLNTGVLLLDGGLQPLLHDGLRGRLVGRALRRLRRL